MNEVESAITKWEDKVKKLKKVGEKFSEGLMTAILTNMMPDTIRDMLFTQLEEGASYVKTVEKVKNLVSNKTDLGGAIPMDIGQVGNECGKCSHGHGGQAAAGQGGASNMSLT